MKSFYTYTVPKLARNLAGLGNSPPLIDNSPLRVPQATVLRRWLLAVVGSLGLLNPFRWRRPRITQRPLVQLSVSGLFLILTLCSFSVHAGIISTIAGTGTGGSSGDGGAATSAQLNSPAGVAVDSSGNLYIADSNNHRLRKVTPDGVISTVAGISAGGYSGDGGVATSAKLNSPRGVAVDSSGNLYIADSFNHRLRKVTPDGTISTVAGTSTGGYSGDFGAATSAQLKKPSGVAVDSSGNLYIADKENHSIRKVTPDGTISTVAGTGTQGYSGDFGAATSAKLNNPLGVAVDSSGNLYIADTFNHRLRKITLVGVISTVAGTGTLGYSGDGGAATSAQLFRPYSVAVDSGGNLYIAEYGNQRLRKITPGGLISTVAGTGTEDYGGDGGLATSAQFKGPSSVAVDSSGNLYVADSMNNRLRKVTPAPTINVQGNSTSIVSGDTTPTTTDNTDFGSTPVGTPVSQTFTINNIGELPLNLTGSPEVSVTGSGFSVTTQPTSPVAAFTGTTNWVIQFAPTAAGVSNGTVSIANDDSLNNPYTFSITATGTNTAPVANDGSFTTNEDTAGSGTVTATDANGDSLTYSLVTNGSKGSATLTASTGAYTYTPTLNQNGTDTFTFLANDGAVDSNLATITMTITPVNDAPVANNGTLTTTEDTAGSGTLTASEVDANPLTYSFVTNGTKGTATVTDANTGAYTYTPNANQTGTDTVTFKVNDGTADSNVATINITITPAPLPPPAPVTTTPEPPPPLPPMTLTVSVSGTGTGSITSTPAGLDCSPTSALCTYTVTTPTWVTLTATPAEGSKWSQWGGDAACRSDGKVLVIADTTCQATFELQSYELTVGRFGDGYVTGSGIECPPDCTETFLYGTEVQLEAKADREWIHTGWKGSCDQTGKLTVTHDQLCHAVFKEDPTVPNQLDGNGDGIPDAHQPNVISLPDKVVGNYVSFEVQPDTCLISDVYTDLPEKYGKPDKNKPLPQGLIYFELGCPQAQISVYYHAISVVRRNFIFQKFGPKVPGDMNTVDWFTLPNVTFEAVKVGGKSVVKATYTITDGGLGDSTGVDGRIVDPGGLVVK